MIDYCNAKRFIEEMPWGELRRPLLVLDAPSSTRVVLHSPHIARHVVVQGESTESALRHALKAWASNVVEAKGEALEALHTAAGKLQN